MFPSCDSAEMRAIKEYAFFTEVRYKWTIGNRYLYYIANEEQKTRSFLLLQPHVEQEYLK
jgi:hypothetical protein